MVVEIVYEATMKCFLEKGGIVVKRFVLSPLRRVRVLFLCEAFTLPICWGVFSPNLQHSKDCVRMTGCFPAVNWLLFQSVTLLSHYKS